MVVGSVLLLTVSGTLGVMSAMDIELQRISLGALMIAMGMLVDNAIVIAEGMVVGVQRGLSPQAAAERSVKRTQYALLGATVIGILAFAPIGLSQDNAGQYLGTLFRVVAISLLLSWVLAITVVPLFGSMLLRQKESGGEQALYSGWGYAPYRALIRFGLRQAWLSAVAILAITFACFWGFQFVKVGFFPGSNTPIFFVDYYLPQGTDILTTSREFAELERQVMQQPGVEAVSAFVGQGTLRFASTIRPELPNTAYAHMLVRVADVEEMNEVMRRVGDQLRELALDAEIRIRRTEFNYNEGSKIEARFSGTDSAVLRELADEALDVYLRNDLPDLKTNWRQRELQIVPKVDDARARVAGVTRGDVYRSLAFSTFGVQVGLFREADKLLPIIARAPVNERLDVSALPERSVWSPAQQSHIPMSQIVSEFQLVAEDSMIFRRQRERSISAFANPPVGHNATEVFERIRPQIEAIPLPPGYVLEWGGEYESSKRAEGSLFTKIPMTFGLMLVVTILMFGKLRQPIVIWLTVPMTVCGVVISLLVTDLSFTFPSILGLLSLSGMLIKNCVVLVDEIDKRMIEETPSLEVIAAASVSRLRPVMLAAGTTIAGMSPLLGDVFFREMAVCIMGGLAFATLLTLVAVPVFYRLAFARELRGAGHQAAAQHAAAEPGYSR
jgi:multidrug efflux pump subunit AcrB